MENHFAKLLPVTWWKNYILDESNYTITIALLKRIRNSPWWWISAFLSNLANIAQAFTSTVFSSTALKEKPKKNLTHRYDHHHVLMFMWWNIPCWQSCQNILLWQPLLTLTLLLLTTWMSLQLAAYGLPMTDASCENELVDALTVCSGIHRVRVRPTHASER